MRVILGVDGSEPSLVAQRLLVGAAWPRPLEVTLVSAYERPMDWSGTVALAFLPSDEVALRAEITGILDELAEPLRRAGCAIDVVVRAGRAATVLADVAREQRADLLVVGNRGRGPTRAALLGSVSAALVDHAPCPVLVARRSGVRRILFAVDGSETSDHAADILVRWRVFADAHVDVLHVSTDAGTDRVAARMATRLALAGWATQPMVRSGEAAREITATAAELDEDLIVTGSRGLGDLQRMVSGSVAHDVLLHTGASVLVMRGQVHAAARERERATSTAAFAY